MPRRDDIKSILIIGSGPIVIGQGCEFDYSGTQACKALKEEGYRVILINSNPATISTNPELADATYVEPINTEFLEKIIKKEKPDAILPTVGGQVSLNAALELAEQGILKKHNVNLIGANYDAIKKAEDRELFKKAMDNIRKETGLQTQVPKSGFAHTIKEAEEVLKDIGLPLIIRPAFTLGGSGGSIVYNIEEFKEKVFAGLQSSPISQILIEESVAGWKEFELEIMRDRKDNVVVICSIENIDPMGIHTGDSITVAPQQTLSDKEYQNLRNMAIAIIREIGVDTGGCNIQFAVNPEDGDVYVIEMNPRVSRSSALASKATGFPIAKIAAKLAVGYTLDEIQNDITRVTPSSFEPTIDYVVTKIPRWNFEKFEGVDDNLGSAMKSVGEAMSIGRTLKESFQKCLRSLETDRFGFGSDFYFKEMVAIAELEAKEPVAKIDFLKSKLSRASDSRIFFIKLALNSQMTIDEIHALTKIDKYFLHQFADLFNLENSFKQNALPFLISHGILKSNSDLKSNNSLALTDNNIDTDRIKSTLTEIFKNISKSHILEMKKNGFSNRQLAYLILDDFLNLSLRKHIHSTASFKIKKMLTEFIKNAESFISDFLLDKDIIPSYKLVDTCAGEFESYTPYLYSTFDEGNESLPTNANKVIILGGGPNRIGQGIEFDYCCCHASFALQDKNIESIIVNSNPETVSTDYDTSDRLYFEPMTSDDVLAIAKREKPLGVIIQFGGQTPLKLAKSIKNAGIPILGTPVDAIDRAEDRQRFLEMIKKLGLKQPEGAIIYSKEESLEAARKIGFPVLVRPSYVLGGRAMAIIRDEGSLMKYLEEAEHISQEQPILIDKFLQSAIEVDVDALSDGKKVYIGGIMEHIEEAGIHSGDSACCLPAISIPEDMLIKIENATEAIGKELGVIGLLNIQFAIRNNDLYVIEVNPRASRTVPFVSKATNVPLARYACFVMLGQTIDELKLPTKPWHKRRWQRYYVKEAVLPFKKFPGVDTILGPEMKSTGEVMGIGKTSGEAFYKSQIASGQLLPLNKANVFLSLNNKSKEKIWESAALLAKHEYNLICTNGTAQFLKEKAGIEVEKILKVHEGRPNIVDAIKSNKIDLVINTPGDYQTRHDAFEIRQSAVKYNVPYITTTEAAIIAMQAMCEMKTTDPEVYSLQDIVHGNFNPLQESSNS